MRHRVRALAQLHASYTEFKLTSQSLVREERTQVEVKVQALAQCAQRFQLVASTGTVENVFQIFIRAVTKLTRRGIDTFATKKPSPRVSPT